MKNKFTKKELSKIKKFNSLLKSIEKKIFIEAIEQNKLAVKKLSNKTNNLYDYALEVNLQFYTHNKEILSFIEYVKSTTIDKLDTNINDSINHNIGSCCWKNKKLNSQNHCWLLHRLYDDFHIKWKNILKIYAVLFDINMSYQYKFIKKKDI